MTGERIADFGAGIMHNEQESYVSPQAHTDAFTTTAGHRCQENKRERSLLPIEFPRWFAKAIEET
jgi:hypothetical protein